MKRRCKRTFGPIYKALLTCESLYPQGTSIIRCHGPTHTDKMVLHVETYFSVECNSNEIATSRWKGPKSTHFTSHSCRIFHLRKHKRRSGEDVSAQRQQKGSNCEDFTSQSCRKFDQLKRFPFCTTTCSSWYSPLSGQI